MMFDYPNFADMVGTTVKTMWAPLLPEAAHREAFNTLVDAKVALNKNIYEANKNFVEKFSDAVKSVSVK